MLRKFLNVQPSELKFPFQLNKLTIVWVELTNKFDQNVAFKVKTTHPKKYCVRPTVGVISPGSTCVVKVSMQAQKVFPVALPKDKFLIQSMIAPVGLCAEDITSEMFKRQKCNDVEEFKLRVVFVTADPPSPIPEVSEEDFSPEASELKNPNHRNHIMELFDAGPNTDREEDEQIFKDRDRISQLIDERSFLMLKNQQLQNEVEMARRQIFRSTSNSCNVIALVLLACFLGFVVGYVIK